MTRRSLTSQASQLDPLSPIISTSLGTRYRFAGRNNEALQHLQQTLDMHPTYPLARFWLGQTFQHIGRNSAAIVAAEAAVRGDSASPMMHLGLARLYALTGRAREARQIANDIQQRYADHFSPVHMAWVFSALGDMALASSWLERAYDAHDGWLNNLTVDPALTAMRSLPAVQRLRERLRL